MTHQQTIWIAMKTDDNGEYIRYEDYARLKAAAHDDDTCPHLVRANLLEAENAHLKAEVENLLPKDYYDPLLYHCGECQRMSAYLAFATSKYIRADTEIARLKAEVERLTAENKSLQTKATNTYNAMVVRCKVEEITHKAKADSIISQGMMSEAIKLMEESMAIREQVERLTKAGDAVCESPYLWETDPSVIAWRAAKEGKQP